MAAPKEPKPEGAFNGFHSGTIEFLMAIRFNNNREFFLENREWYERDVREPARALADALGETVRAMDPYLEIRPQRVVSRINRDVRFSRDKSPYRDNVWLAFRRPGEERNTALGVYFDLSVEGGCFGMGYYDENRPMMNALRRQILTAPEQFLELSERAMRGFTLYPKAMKRMPIPESLPEALRPWYALRGFYMERELRDFSLLYSSALVGELCDGYRQLTPFYQYLTALAPEASPDETKIVAPPRTEDG